MVVAGTMLVYRSRPGASLVCTHPHVLVVFVERDDRDGRLLYATQDLTLLVLDRSALGQLLFEEHVALESLSLFPADEFGDALVDTTRINERGRRGRDRPGSPCQSCGRHTPKTSPSSATDHSVLAILDTLAAHLEIALNVAQQRDVTNGRGDQQEHADRPDQYGRDHGQEQEQGHDRVVPVGGQV